MEIWAGFNRNGINSYFKYYILGFFFLLKKEIPFQIKILGLGSFQNIYWFVAFIFYLNTKRCQEKFIAGAAIWCSLRWSFATPVYHINMGSSLGYSTSDVASY